MATKRVGTIFVELDLDPKRYMRAQQTMVKESKSGAKILEKNFKNLGIKSNATFDLMRNQAVQSFEAIKRSGKATANDLIRAEKAKAEKIKQINEQQYGHQTTLIENLKAHWKGYAVAVTAALYAIQKVGKKAIVLAMEQEKAQIALGAALRANSEYTDDLMNQYTAFASSIQKVTTYGDEQILKLMALQKNLGVTSDRLEEATRASIGLAAATGRDVQSMAMYIALAEQGEFTMLRRYIPALRSTTDKTEQLRIITEFAARGFLVAQESAQTFSGGLEQLKNLYGDVFERIGDVIVKNEAILALMEKGKQTLQEWAEYIERWVNANDKLIAQKTHEAITKIADALKLMVGIYKVLPDGIIGATGVGIIGRILTGSTPFGVFIAALMLLNENLQILPGNLRNITKEMRDMEATALEQMAIPPGQRGMFGGGRPSGGAGGGYGPSPGRIKLSIKGPGIRPALSDEPDMWAKGWATAEEAIQETWRQAQYGFNQLQQQLLSDQQSFADMKKAINDISLQDRIEAEQTALKKIREMNEKQAARDKALRMEVLSAYQQAAGGIANTFMQIAQAGGKQSKKAFKMYQAFAIVEAMIGTALAVTKTLGQLGAWGIPLAIAIGAMGTVQIAMIESAKPPSYDQGGISRSQGIYQTGNIDEAHIPLKSGKVPVQIKGDRAEGQTIIIKMENPVFQDVATQRQVFAQIAEVIARKVAPNAVVVAYDNDHAIRSRIRGRK